MRPAQSYTDLVPTGTAEGVFAVTDCLRPGHLLGSRAVLVPVKAFSEAKRRLAPALSDTARGALVRSMAERVLRAAHPLPVAVVCDDTAVADWARRLGALVVWEPGRGLNGAVEAGVEHLSSMGVEHVTVAHSDLPRASGLGLLEPFDGVTLVPDRREDGTNVLRLPADSGFGFAYGPGSFARHLAECERLGLATRIVRDPGLVHDVDWPADLED
jgi:2-phospho-L-lactate guanylyltransferase